MQTNKGGYRKGAGRKSRKEKGLEEVVSVSAKVENSVADTCKEKFGTYANALRYAAKK